MHMLQVECVPEGRGGLPSMTAIVMVGVFGVGISMAARVDACTAVEVLLKIILFPNYDSKDNMPMQEEDEEYIQKYNSDNDTASTIGIIANHNSDDDSSNKSLNDDSSTISNDEEEGDQYDFDEWFEEQMDNHDNKSEKSSGKEDNFVQFLDNITSNSLMDYENEMTKKTRHLPPIPPEMQDAIQLLSLLNTSKASFSLYEKIVKWRQSSKSATDNKKCQQEKKC